MPKRAWCPRCQAWSGVESRHFPVGRVYCQLTGCGREITDHRPVDIDDAVWRQSVADAKRRRAEVHRRER